MEEPCLPPVSEAKRPDLPCPQGACDAHFHIFGPVDRFPYAESRAYTPPEAPLEVGQAVAIIEAEMEATSERDDILEFIKNSQRGIMKGYISSN